MTNANGLFQDDRGIPLLRKTEHNIFFIGILSRITNMEVPGMLFTLLDKQKEWIEWAQLEMYKRIGTVNPTKIIIND